MRFRLLWTVFKKMFLDFSIQVLSCSLKYSKSPGGHPRWINLKTLCKKRADIKYQKVFFRVAVVVCVENMKEEDLETPGLKTLKQTSSAFIRFCF